MKSRKLKAFVTAFMVAFTGAAAIMPEMLQNEITANASFWIEEEEEPTYTYGDLTYTVSDDAVTITDCSDTAVNVEVPSEIDGMPVTGIGSYAFADLSELETLIIPESVDSIGDSAFINCTKLTTLTLPKQVENFGNYPILKHIEIDPETGAETSKFMTGAYDMFSGCESLTAIELPEGAGGFEGGGGFYGCTSLKSLYISSTVCMLHDGNHGGFEGDIETSLDSCTSLETITIHPDNKNYEMVDGALLGEIYMTYTGESEPCEKSDLVCYLNNSDTSYKVPDSVEKICAYAFNNSTSLEEIILPEGLESISRGAFYNCTSLQSLHIPASVENITYAPYDGGLETFHNCISLKEITVDEANENYRSIDGVLYSYSDSSSVLMKYPAAKEGTSFTVPEVVNICGRAFANSQNLEEVIIPEGITCINNTCFYDCKALKTISLPSTLEYIFYAAFYECTSLTDVVLPESLTYIEGSAFYNCSSLGALNIPANVSSIGEYAFENYSGLTEITVDPANENFTAENGVLFTKDMTKLIVYPAADTDESYTVPSTVTTMSNSSFHSARYLKEVILPEGITEIPLYAFSKCKVLEKVTLPSSLTSIQGSAFYACESMKSIEIPESVTYIGESAFVHCAKLDSIKILNAECEIFYDPTTIDSNTVIYGYSGSTAEAYAEEYGRIFVSLDNDGLLGDVDRDGAVSIDDAVDVLSYYAKNAAGISVILGADEEEHEKTFALADIDSDGALTLQDAALILSYYARSAAGITGGWNAVLNG